MEEKIIEKLRKIGSKKPEELISAFVKYELAPKEVLDSISLKPKNKIISEHYPFEKKMERVVIGGEVRGPGSVMKRFWFSSRCCLSMPA